MNVSMYLFICMYTYVLICTYLYKYSSMSLLVKTSTVPDHLCVRLASSVRGASERKSESRGFESHVRLTLYLKSKNFSTTLNIIYIT